MLKRVTTTCMVLFLLLPALCASASAYSILWAATSDYTCLVKEEEYEAAPVLMLAVSGVEVASESVECEDGGLEILYEESVPEELAGVDEAVSPDLIGVEEKPAPEPISVEDETELSPEGEPEEIELEEPLYDEIQIP